MTIPSGEVSTFLHIFPELCDVSTRIGTLDSETCCSRFVCAMSYYGIVLVTTEVFQQLGNTDAKCG